MTKAFENVNCSYYQTFTVRKKSSHQELSKSLMAHNLCYRIGTVGPKPNISQLRLGSDSFPNDLKPAEMTRNIPVVLFDYYNLQFLSIYFIKRMKGNALY